MIPTKYKTIESLLSGVNDHPTVDIFSWQKEFESALINNYPDPITEQNFHLDRSEVGLKTYCFIDLNNSVQSVSHLARLDTTYCFEVKDSKTGELLYISTGERLLQESLFDSKSYPYQEN